MTVPHSVPYVKANKNMMYKTISIYVDVDELGRQYQELQDLLSNQDSSRLWGVVEMIGDMLDEAESTGS